MECQAEGEWGKARRWMRGAWVQESENIGVEDIYVEMTSSS